MAEVHKDTSIQYPGTLIQGIGAIFFITLGEVEARERGEGFACLSFRSIFKTAGIFCCLTLLIDLTSAY